MKEQTVKTLPSNLQASLQEIREQAAHEISKNGYTPFAAVLLALTELVKEQLQNENLSNTTR
jgi:hypothetical protein